MAFSFTLNTGRTIPAIGYGTYKSIGEDSSRVFAEAIRQGYRYIDTASFYENETEVGRAGKGKRRCAVRAFSRLQGVENRDGLR